MELVVGKTYLTRRITEPTSIPHWRKYFGEGKWGSGWGTPEFASKRTTHHFSNTNAMVTITGVPWDDTPPVKKERRCLNPA